MSRRKVSSLPYATIDRQPLDRDLYRKLAKGGRTMIRDLVDPVYLATHRNRFSSKAQYLHESIRPQQPPCQQQDGPRSRLIAFPGPVVLS